MTPMLSRTVVSLALVLGAGAAQAADPVVGAVVGAGAGAVIGQVVGGRDGAVIGGAIGAVTGAAVSTHRPRFIVGTGYAMAPMAPAPRMMPVQEGYYEGPDVFFGPYPPPPRGPGQWRLTQDEYGRTFWLWEPAVVYVPPPVYSVPVYPAPIYPAPAYPPHRDHYHSRPYPPRNNYYTPAPPRMQPPQPPRWGGPPRYTEPVRGPSYRPPAANPPAAPPAYRNPSGPPPQYRPPPGR